MHKKTKKCRKLKFTFINSFRISTAIITLLNIIFLIMFYIKGITPLVIFNICVIILFLYFSVFYINKNIVLATIITFIECSIQTLFYVYFIGWGNGFYVYPLCLIPIIYFVTINILKKEKYGHILVILTFVIYQIAKIFSQGRMAQYEHMVMPINDILYMFNTISGSSIYAFLMYAFLSEMRDTQEALEEKNKALKDMANIDLLTGISNRRCMNDKIKEYVDKFKIDKKSFCIAICDIDNFKSINDTYGHDCGDMVLKMISQILMEESKKRDIEVCRWGGEEFLILIRDTIIGAERVCQKILDETRKQGIKYNNHYIKVTMTMGVAELNLKNDNIDEILKKADVNLYKGKTTTKNCVIID